MYCFSARCSRLGPFASSGAAAATGVDMEDDNPAVASGVLVGIGTAAGVGVAASRLNRRRHSRCRCVVCAGIRRRGTSVARIVFLAGAHQREFDAATHGWS